MINIDYFKFGIDKYLNNFESDKNSGLYEYHLIRKELEKIDFEVKEGTLVVLNGLMSNKEMEFIENKIDAAHLKGAKTIYIVTDEIAFTNIDLMNKFDLVLHQAWKYNFDCIKCEQKYSYVPELFFTDKIDIPMFQHNLVLFCGNSKDREDKIKMYLRNNCCNAGTFSLIKNEEKDERVEHSEYIKLQKMFKYSLMICRESYRECGWITARLIEAIDNWSLPVFDIDYDINKAYKIEDVCGYEEMYENAILKKDTSRMWELTVLRVKVKERRKLFAKQILEFCK